MPTIHACTRLSIAPRRFAARVLSLTLISVVIASLGWLTAAAAACIDYAFNPRLAGRLDTGFNASHTVALDGSLAYLVSYDTRLYIVDVSDADAPTIVGELATDGSARDVAVDGTYAYVADFDAGTHVIDVSESTTPTLVATVPTTAGAYEVAIEGATLCIAAGDEGLQIVDIADPSTPQILSVLPFANTVRQVIFENSLACVIENVAGLRIVDVSNPSAPSVIGSAPYVADDMAVSGDHVFLSTGRPNPFREGEEAAATAGDEYGLRILDVSDPTQPVQVGWSDNPGHDVALLGDVAILTEIDWNMGEGIVRLLDISDLANPTRTAYLGSTREIRDVAAQSGLICLGDARGMELIRAADFHIPPPVGQCSTTNAIDIAIAGTHAYVADDDGGFRVLEVSDPASPSLAASLAIGEISSVATSGDLALAGGRDQFHVIDVSDPAAPWLRATLPVDGGSVDASGSYAYMLQSVGPNDSVLVVEIADPDLPVIVGRLPMNRPSDLRADGVHVYVTDWYAGLHVLDVSVPSSPVIVGTVALPDLLIAQRLAIEGQTAYVSDVNTGVMVVDVSDPSAPETRAYIEPPPPGPANMAASGDLLYVGNGTQILVYDVSDRAAPVEVGAIYPPGLSHVALSGDHLCVAAYGAGVVTYLQQCGEIVGVSSSAPVVPGAGLRVFPSPSSGPVTIELDLDRPLDGVVEVFDAAGRRVRRIIHSARVTTLVWDSRDDDGRLAAPGVYWVRLRSAVGSAAATSKVVLTARD